MAEEKYLALVLTFSGEVESAFSKLREDYQPYMGYTIVPHITLYLFRPEADMKLICKRLEKAAQSFKPFNLVMNGIAFFEGVNNVAYVSIVNQQPVKDLHTLIYQALKGQVQDAWDYNLKRYTPHMTIGEKIPPDIFPNVKKKFSNYEIRYETSITSFSLFSGIDGVWSESRVFKFSG
jgi:2'-5' RNA ligase